MIQHVKHLIQSRELAWAWSSRIIRTRYQQSALGGLWAIVQPVATVAIFSVIFTRFVPIDTAGVPYVVFSYTALVPWTLFAASLTDMTSALVDNMGLVTKVYFPREVLPIAALLARLLDFGIAIGVLVFLMLYYGLSLSPIGWLYLPVVLSVQISLTLGVGLAAAALNVFYRDVRHLLTLGLQLWFYASPIIYPSSLVPEHLRTVYFLNPMAGTLEAYRGILLYDKPPGSYLAVSGLMALGAFLLGYWLFKRLEFDFADVL